MSVRTDGFSHHLNSRQAETVIQTLISPGHSSSKMMIKVFSPKKNEEEQISNEMRKERSLYKYFDDWQIDIFNASKLHIFFVLYLTLNSNRSILLEIPSSHCRPNKRIPYIQYTTIIIYSKLKWHEGVKRKFVNDNRHSNSIECFLFVIYYYYSSEYKTCNVHVFQPEDGAVSTIHYRVAPVNGLHTSQSQIAFIFAS